MSLPTGHPLGGGEEKEEKNESEAMILIKLGSHIVRCVCVKIWAVCRLSLGY